MVFPGTQYFAVPPSDTVTPTPEAGWPLSSTKARVVVPDAPLGNQVRTRGVVAPRLTRGGMITVLLARVMVWPTTVG